MAEDPIKELTEKYNKSRGTNVKPEDFESLLYSLMDQQLGAKPKEQPSTGIEDVVSKDTKPAARPSDLEEATRIWHEHEISDFGQVSDVPIYYVMSDTIQVIAEEGEPDFQIYGFSSDQGPPTAKTAKMKFVRSTGMWKQVVKGEPGSSWFDVIESNLGRRGILVQIVTGYRMGADGSSKSHDHLVFPKDPNAKPEDIYKQVIDLYKKIGNSDSPLPGVEKVVSLLVSARYDKNNKELDTYLREMKKIGAQEK